MTAQLPTPTSIPLGRPGERCTSCSAPLAEDQRYCLNCGLRRGAPRVAYDALLRGDDAEATQPAAGQMAAASSPPRTISPLGAAAGLGLLLLAVIAGSLIGSNRGDGQPAQQVVTVPAAATTPATTTPTAFVSDWQEGDGWTVQLQALPKTGSTPEQVTAAKASATSAGAADVGALDSSAYASLSPDEYVIYSGRYDDEKAAKAALKDLKDSFPDAQVIEVSTTAAGDAAEDTEAAPETEKKTSDSELKELENASPDEFVKKSRKLPDVVVTEGEPPPVDDAAPGGGSEAAEIG